MVPEVEKKVHDRMTSFGNVFKVEATPLHPDECDLREGNYVVSFEGEITVEAESREKAENQVYDRLAILGHVTVAAFKKVQHN